MTRPEDVTGSISGRQVEALNAIAQAGHAIARALTHENVSSTGMVASRAIRDQPLAHQLRALVTTFDRAERPNMAQHLEGLADKAERLEAKRARQAQTIGELQIVRERLTGQVEKVRALHQPPAAASPATRLHGMCMECSRPDREGNPGVLHPWPCETVRAITVQTYEEPS